MLLDLNVVCKFSLGGKSENAALLVAHFLVLKDTAPHNAGSRRFHILPQFASSSTKEKYLDLADFAYYDFALIFVV